MSKSVVVIGAGLAGLSAAFRLQQSGFSVIVLEKLDRPGGRVLTLRLNDFVVDAGPDAMTGGYAEYQSLARDVGCGDAFVPSSSVVGLVRNGRVVDIDTRSILSSSFTPALSWSGKLAMLRGILRVRKLLQGIDSFRLADSAEKDHESETAEQFAQRIFGREVADYIVDPLIRLVVGSGAANASRLSVLGGLVNWSVPLINICGGLDRLPYALADRLQVRYDTEVQWVEEDKGGVTVAYSDVSGDRQQLRADGCVIATTLDAARRVNVSLRRSTEEFSRQLRYLPLVSVSMAFDAPTRSKAYVVQVPTVEDRESLLIFLQHNKAPDRAPPGKSLITFYTDGAVTSQFMSKSDEEMIAWARERIDRLFPEVSGAFRFGSVTRWPVAGYVATPGFWLRIRRLMKEIKQVRVHLAGDLFGAGSMESAVLSGRNVASQLGAILNGAEVSE